MQTPRGPDNLYCPMWRRPMSKVCHTCPLWMSVDMEHPQTGETKTEWNCALLWTPIVGMKHAQMAHRTFRYVEARRNDETGSVQMQALESAKQTEEIKQLREGVERLIVGIAEAADRGMLPARPRPLELNDGRSDPEG